MKRSIMVLPFALVNLAGNVPIVAVGEHSRADDLARRFRCIVREEKKSEHLSRYIFSSYACD